MRPRSIGAATPIPLALTSEPAAHQQTRLGGSRIDGDVHPDTEKIIVYPMSAIKVQKGNPHNIRTLKDLLRPGLKIAIGNPEGVCVGAYAAESSRRNLQQRNVLSNPA